MTATRSAKWAGMVAVLWLLVVDASAQGSSHPRPGRDAGGGSPQRMMPVEQRPEPVFARDVPEPSGGTRLSPEERRQLRRDVNEAGRDLYSDRMPPGRRGMRRQ